MFVVALVRKSGEDGTKFINTDEHYFYLYSSDEKCLFVHVSSA